MGHFGTPAVPCSFKVASGFIYPLERGIIFVYKPPILSSLRMSSRSTGSDSGPREEEDWRSEAEAKKRVKAEKREHKAAWKKTSPLKKEKRGGEGKEEDIVARATKKADVCLLPVAQL